ncbi:type II toxin-antitoxin system RelE/ParE family toxin [Epilithonimonas sp. UC225_85]|uniref:type II toxin-antitoxin system RelE/ParE family toxin n=1 Tax=Epilithonimonas sp. UC225_85 TaxID=3350167 RepID=UPI0036D3C1E4
MALKIFWTDFAKRELKNIFDYYKIKASYRVAQKLVTEIVEKTKILDFQTKIGQTEELLSDRKENFRYLIYKNYKIIYWCNEAKNRIEVVDIFDTRQNPIKIEREK